MHKQYSATFLCPQCRSPLALHVLKKEADLIEDGIFLCPEHGHGFPLIGGIPRFFNPEELPAFVSESLLKEFATTFAPQLPPEWLEAVLKESSRPVRGDLHKSANFYTFQWRK